MSQWNGDKSRFHRERKQNILRRKRTKELLEAAKATTSQTGVSKKPGIAPGPSQIAAQAQRQLG
jgi:hypothetical protein